MIPESSGRAGIAALVLAGAVLLGAAWLAFGTKTPTGDAGGAPDGSGEVVRREARALSNDISKADAPEVPEGAAFRRGAALGGVTVPEDEGEAAPVPADAPPGTEGLAGRVEKDRILLSWRPTGDRPPTGWMVERLGPDGEAEDTWRLPPAATQFRDGLLPAVVGERTYRVTALGVEGHRGGAQQRVVPYRQEVNLAYLGSDPEGAGRFRVGLEGREPAEFQASRGGEIGEEQEEMDWRTGWRFTGLRGTRQSVERETDVPGFTAEGRLRRDAETGEIVVMKRVVPVPQVTEGAVVRVPGTPDVERWLPRSED